jgi:integrase
LDGIEIRKSLGLRDWTKAQELIREWESNRSEPRERSEPISIHQAGEYFFADVKSRGLSDCTIYKYRLLFNRIEAFAKRKGLRYLKELDLPVLDQFRSEWKENPLSSLKKLERLKAFLRFCERRKWIDANPAADMKAPKVPNRPTLPFSREEMLKILAALDMYAKRAGVANAQRVRAFVLLLRYSGMRIGDAVQCGPERLIYRGKLAIIRYLVRRPPNTAALGELLLGISRHDLNQMLGTSNVILLTFST